jgi:hypothetical protein
VVLHQNTHGSLGVEVAKLHSTKYFLSTVNSVDIQASIKCNFQTQLNFQLRTFEEKVTNCETKYDDPSIYLMLRPTLTSSHENTASLTQLYKSMRCIGYENDSTERLISDKP